MIFSLLLIWSSGVFAQRNLVLRHLGLNNNALGLEES